MRTVTQTTTRYFPDDPKNKVFAVDAYVTVARRIMIEAHDKNAAEDAVRKMIDDAMSACLEPEECSKLADMRFHYADERWCACNGEADDDGEVRDY